MKTRNELYAAPSIERIEIAGERGFAASTTEYPGGNNGNSGTVTDDE